MSNFKKLVEARMAKTGESRSTAAGRVRARVADAPRTIEVVAALSGEPSELLAEMHASSTFVVLTGRVPATGRSASLAVAREQATRLANNPQWYAKTGSIEMAVTREQHETLLRHGAADDTEIQVIRSFRSKDIMSFSARCRRCQRWVWCGDEEVEDECVCGARYRVALDLAEVDHGRVREGALCMDCGRDYHPREHLGGPRPWKVFNGAQVQCDQCQQKGPRT
jgi:hypothetical protein